MLEVERKQLMKAKRADLAKGVRWVSKEEGDGAGYDILSFDSSGRRRMIVACCRFRRHRVRCFNGTGGGSWNDASLLESSSLKRCG